MTKQAGETMQHAILKHVMSQLDASPTPYHAVYQAVQVLEAQGFQRIDETDSWSLRQGGKYFVVRRDSSLVAFYCGEGKFAENGLRIVGAHTDSPVLKLKPSPETVVDGYCLTGVEVYGGALLAPWFDRDLSLAGRVSIATKGGIKNVLVNLEEPIAVIPSLAIHLDRNANEGRSINPQEQMNAVWGQLAEGEKEWSLRDLIFKQLEKQGIDVSDCDLIDFDLSLYDVQRASLTGIQKAFLSSARLDNLLSSFIGLDAFVHSVEQGHPVPCVLALFDHEEVGSQSDIGARSNFLMTLLERLCGDRETLYRALRRSAMLSVDNAHGIHPNFRAKHDTNHGPILNRGPVIKYDANQGYATSSQSALFVKQLAADAGVPVQSYVTRADMRCGSTIGPISASNVGIPTVDLGVATFAMHSIREMAGAEDICYLSGILRQFFKTRILSL